MKVSVIIPVYNAESTIEKTLISVKNQTYKNYEIIIIDDGSMDDSSVIVQQFINKNPDLDIKLKKKDNGGVSSARNAGMNIATGDYIALLDADDEWVPEKLEKQIAIFKSNSLIDFLGSNRNGEQFKFFYWKKFHYLTPISSRLLLVKNFLPTPTVMFKRNIINNIGYFDEHQRYAEEGNYWIRVCSSYNCYLVNESLVVTGKGKPNYGFSGLSANLKEMEKGELKNLRFAFDKEYINRFSYILLIGYSLLKYVKRVLVVRLRTK